MLGLFTSLVNVNPQLIMYSMYLIKWLTLLWGGGVESTIEHFRNDKGTASDFSKEEMVLQEL